MEETIWSVNINMTWRLIPFSTMNAYWNMAIDEAILESREEGKTANTLRFYRWEPSAASIGRNQAIEEEINLKSASKLGIDIVRRISGGGAVFHHSQSEITYSVIIAEDEFFDSKKPSLVFKIAKGIHFTLENFGLPVEEQTIHCPSIFIHGKKISGNAQVKRGGIILQHGTFLLKNDPNLMYSILKVKGQKSKRKMVQSVFQHVTTLENELGYIPKLEEVITQLQYGFQKAFDVEFNEVPLSQDEKSLAKQLMEEKYSSEEWNFKY